MMTMNLKCLLGSVNIVRKVVLFAVSEYVITKSGLATLIYIYIHTHIMICTHRCVCVYVCMCVCACILYSMPVLMWFKDGNWEPLWTVLPKPPSMCKGLLKCVCKKSCKNKPFKWPKIGIICKALYHCDCVST